MLPGSVPRLFVSALLVLPLLACESTGDPKPTRAAHVHPDIPARPSPEMIAQSSLGMTDRGEAGAPPVLPPKNWKASCLVHRACPTKEQPLSVCEKGKSAPRWSELQFQAESLVGKTVDVMGMLGISASPSTANLNVKCAPDTCCHALRMGITLEGEPASLALAGLSCAGDDSKLCCSVPANSQNTIAHGRLAKAPGNGAGKWQLEDVTLCEVEVPQGPDH